MNSGDGKGGTIGDGTGEKRAAPDEEKPKIGRREVQSDAEIIEGRHHVPSLRIWVSSVQGGDGEISVEHLVDENRGEELSWVRNGERGGGRFNEIGVNILRLIAMFENKILEEGIGGKRGRKEVGSKES